MKIVFWAKGARGFHCLKRLLEEGYSVDLVITQSDESGSACSAHTLAGKHEIKCIIPNDPNDDETKELLISLKPDIFVLGGYGKILQKHIIDIPRIMTINLHGGKLPDRRGSSPMNWALIDGERKFTLSIIQVDEGIDTGPILVESTHPIEPQYTIVDLHRIANEMMPTMLVKVLNDVKRDEYRKREQEKKDAAYYPLRFPEDGFILFDQHTAEEVYNRIRALTVPYPCAFSIYKKRRVKLIAAELTENPCYGEPGRIYKKNNDRGILVCAQDKCLWLTNAIWEDSGESIFPEVHRYDQMLTMKSFVLEYYSK